jgi:hypothetical protein
VSYRRSGQQRNRREHLRKLGIIAEEKQRQPQPQHPLGHKTNAQILAEAEQTQKQQETERQAVTRTTSPVLLRALELLEKEQ